MPQLIRAFLSDFIKENLDDEAISRQFAEFAINEKNRAIKEEHASSIYDKYVDSKKGEDEFSVKPDGVILYKFQYLGQATKMAMEHLIKHSPSRHGEFKKSWFFTINNNKWDKSYDDIPPDCEIFITNHKPFTRKIELGTNHHIDGAAGLILKTRLYIRREWKNINAERIFINIKPGSFPDAPYFLKGHSRKTKKGHSGEEMRYPALILTNRDT